ncbi:MAG: transcription antitermination factor NusB [Oscillospiraceae bacterium]|nr:transcription antitermination factor NusB [Oscillospiraceae bacterium]
MPEKLTRHEIREAALMLLYQIELASGGTEDLSGIAADCVEAFGFAFNSTVVKLVEGILNNKAAIDEVIQKYSPTRKIERIPKINLCITRIAVYEMDFMPDIPDKVAVNEAIELSKEYAYKPDSQFISGLLGAHYKEKTGSKGLEDEQ